MVQREASLSEQEPQATWEHLSSVIDDRRRPERLDHVNPTLIPLLRGALTPGLPLGDRTDLVHDRGELAPASGIAVILVLSAFLWAVIGLAGWAIVHGGAVAGAVLLGAVLPDPVAGSRPVAPGTGATQKAPLGPGIPVPPFKLNQGCRYPVLKQKHKAMNWYDRDASLCQRGSLTV